MSVLDSLTTLFAPDDCLSCGREGWLLCRSCRTTVPPLPGRCFGCDAKLVGVACADCVATTPLHSISAATHYRGAAKELVSRLKFNGNRSAARLMADIMNRLVRVQSDMLVVHVPATPQHIRQRGYDQAELIAKQLANRLRLPRAALLRRSGKAHQLGASRQVRHQQLSAAIHVVRPAAVKGRQLLLIDDVLTTGSSLTAAAAALRTAGATQVDAVVFAQAIKNTQ